MADVFLIKDAISASGIDAEVQTVNDGELATRLFDATDRELNAPCLRLVILDINLPKKRGPEVLDHLRKSERCRDTPVIVASTSGSAADVDLVMSHGANRYFRKPSEYNEFLKLADLIRELFPKGQKP